MIPDYVTSELKERFRQARRVGILTGAGVSAESGVPTFRGGGESATWKGWPFEKLSSVETVRSNPTLLWEWFDYRREIISRVKPNPAHYTLADWEHRFESLTLVTQNIDDLHRMAGSRDPLELHGNIWRVRCLGCGQVTENRDVPIRENPPRCECGGILRPDVVLFGELLPERTLQRAMDEAARSDLFFVVGTSAIVYPAAYVPMTAKRGSAFLIEVNAEETPLSSWADATVLGRAGEILPQFTEADE